MSPPQLPPKHTLTAQIASPKVHAESGSWENLLHQGERIGKLETYKSTAAMIFKNLTELQNSLRNSDSLKSEFLQDPEKFILNARERHPIWNKKVFLTIVGFLGLALILSMVIAAVIVLQEPVKGLNQSGEEILLRQEVDDYFIMIGSTSMGALAGLLIPNPDN